MIQRIKELKSGSEIIKLSFYESKLIEVLSNEELNTWEDIGIYMYGYYDKYIQKIVYAFKKRLINKTKINIKVINQVGLKLIDKIYIN